MNLLGLDVNATRLRAVRGPVGDYACAEPVDPPHAELPLVLTLGGRTPVLGAAGLKVCRKAPQHFWQNFLPQLGEIEPKGAAGGPTKKPPATKALGLAFQHIMQNCRESDGVVLALPAYLSGPQVEQVLTVADQAGLPLLGSISSPLAAALAGYADQLWTGPVVVVDVDDHALTLATIESDLGQAQLLDLRCFHHLNKRAWRERLLNALADCCILDTRWDPRESPAGEQSLFDHLDNVLDAAVQGRMIKVTVRAPGRFQSLVLQASDSAAFCTTLCRQAMTELERIFAGHWPEGAPSSVLLTAAASRLPGLSAALQTMLPQWQPAVVRNKPKTSLSTLEDFGSGLLDEDEAEAGGVVVLTPGATARGAHSVAAYFKRGDIPCGHLPTAAPLPLPLPLEAGPARLHYQGQEYLLGSASFAMGRHPTSDLVFDGEQWPHVSARHCDIIYDHRAHMLCDRSRQGTLVNDRPTKQAVPLRPGDWIRLGPEGPLVRFLGQSMKRGPRRS